MNRRTLRTIVLIWLVWSIVLIGYMQIVQMRYEPDRPDTSLQWTGDWTNRNSQRGKDYLLEPFLNTQVSWDSEYYLSVATVGYDDPEIALVETPHGDYSTSYAFFPLYPILIKAMRLPFALLGMTPIAASVAAGVLISLLGTLAGMIALYDIVREELGEQGGLRTIFYLLIFPTSMFFAVVYTEGLFIGLAFGSLALMRRKQFVLAAVLAALATWTRSIGAVLVLPMLIAWVLAYRQTAESLDKRKLLFQLPVLALPVIAYGLWRLVYGVQFDAVEEFWFGNRLLDIPLTLQFWGGILERAQTNEQTLVVVALQIVATFLCLVSIVVCLRRYPELAVFGFLALLVPFTAGGTSTQSTLRYVLVVPTLWVMLGRWGRSTSFDRGWTVASVLLLAMQAYLFSYDMWVA